MRKQIACGIGAFGAFFKPQRWNIQRFERVGFFQRKLGFKLHILARTVLQFLAHFAFRQLQNRRQLGKLLIANCIPVNLIALAFGRVNRFGVKRRHFQITAHRQNRAVAVGNRAAQRRAFDAAHHAVFAKFAQLAMMLRLHAKAMPHQHAKRATNRQHQP